MSDSIAAPLAPSAPSRGLLDRGLGLFGDVRAGESGRALLLLANIFLILAGYYVCKTVREPWVLESGGAEVKSYSSAGQALLLMGFIPLYGWFASRVDRWRLILGVTLFFVVNLELFWLGAQADVPYLGIAFFVWTGIFNNAIVAQFWSYANDLYTPEAGERLFPLIAIGGTLGSPLGAKVAGSLFERGVHGYSMLHITAVILLVTVVLYALVERREGEKRHQVVPPPLAHEQGGFGLVLRSPYLRLVCVLLLTLNLVNTTGEYILSHALKEQADAQAAANAGFNKEAFIGSFYGSYLFYVNILTVLIQMLVASRIVKYLGMAGALLALPVVALGTYGWVFLGAGLAAIRWAKTAENATDYSIMNTARQLLWLPTSREEKYKAKQVTDTFVVRAGDVLSAGLVFAGTHWLGLTPGGFAAANLIVVALWMAVGLMLLREHRALMTLRERAPSGAEARESS